MAILKVTSEVIDVSELTVALQNDATTGGLRNYIDANLAVALGINDTAVNSVKWDGSTKTISTAPPSGGVDGDIWFQYE